MTHKIMVTNTFGGVVERFEAKSYLFYKNGAVVEIVKCDGTRIIVPTSNIMIEFVHE